MLIDYDGNKNQFIISCSYEENRHIVRIPERRWRKGSKTWAVPALRRNVEYLNQHLSNQLLYTPTAYKIFLEKTSSSLPPSSSVRFPSWYKFKNPPLKHQTRAFNKFYGNNEVALLFEQGLGKTFTAINLATAWRMEGIIDAAVVICPSSIKLVWEDELHEHCPIPYQAHALTAGKYARATRFIENKDDFQWLIVGVEGLSQGKAIDHIKSFALPRKIAIIIDESSRIKTPGKTRTNRCIELNKYSEKRIILSGTSITQGIEDFYTQFKFLNEDILGFDSYYTYRAHFCIIAQIEIDEDKTVPKIVGYKNEDELIRLVSPYALRVEKKDALDLPDKIFQTRQVKMGKKQAELYATMKHELYIQAHDAAESYEVTTVLEQTLRLQQITGGHYPSEIDSKIQPVVIPGVNPKIEELSNLLDEIAGKVVVWCQLRPEIELVAALLRRKDIEYVTFHGGMDSDYKRLAVKEFREGTPRVFLATKAAAYGLTLIEAHTSIYYSQGYSLDTYEQSQDRIHRIGQEISCDYIHLVCSGTIDNKVIRALAEKKSVSEFIYTLLKENDDSST